MSEQQDKIVEDAIRRMLAPTYRVTDEEKAVFGEHWCGPDQYPEDYSWSLIADYTGDGGLQSQVHAAATPARFYKIVAISDNIELWSLTTGSSEDELARDIAVAISTGMLGQETES